MSSVPALVESTRSRLVIVEDEAILAMSIERTLREFGFDVRGVAANADDALAMVERERPDLVLMDIRIQGSRDGIATAEAIRERYDTAIVFLTAHSDPRTIERAQGTQPFGYLLKPFKTTDLQNIVSIALMRRVAERELRRREQALRITLSAIDEAVITTDLDGAVTSLNDAATQLVGRPDDDVLNKPLAEVIPLRRGDAGVDVPKDTVAEAKGCERVHLEGVIDTPRGERSVLGTAVALRHRAVPFGVVVALRDLSDLLLARRQLEFAARLTSLGEMAAGIAHELNNPLSVVVANLNFALEEPLDEDLRAALRDASDGAQRVARIVSDLRTMSRPQTEPATRIDPREILMAALQFTRSSWRNVAGVDLRLERVPAILGSPPRLTQVLVNLIINASHAMAATPGRAHRLTLTAGTDTAGRAVLSVADTGPGVPDALCERIFEPFFTTKAAGKGTGLGLSVSRSIVKQHLGADMSLESSAAGARFIVSFPAAGELEPRPVRLVWIGEPRSESTALGCDPLPVRGEVIREALGTDHPVVIAAVPQSALRTLNREAPELDGRFVWLSEDAPGVGNVRLLTPFDPAALACFHRED